MFFFSEFGTPLHDFWEKLLLDKFDFISFSVLEVMRSPLAPTVYRRSRQQRGVVPPVFYISKSRGDYFDPKKYFHVSFYPSFCFWFLVDLVTMLRKYYAFFVYFLQVKMGKTEKKPERKSCN